ncbi:MAG TPA: site-specific integrase, partial [Fimbriiglobus sp.]|nr:site-specific integrase [Fimbriiglobus sp.]
MPRPRNALPSYRLHRQSGQAVVTVRTPDGRRRDVLLGPYNSPESKAEYERVLAELRVSPTATPSLPDRRLDLTVAELALAYLRYAEGYYVGPDGKPTSTLTGVRLSLRPLRQLYGHTPAREFGPLALKAVRQKFAESGIGRVEVNRRTRVVRRAFKWGVAEELVPANVYHALAAVEGLRKGRSELSEPAPVRPVEVEHVRATLPYLPPTVAAMVEVQLLTGMRPGEVCLLRPADIDRSGSVWLYKPGHHKTAHAGRI